LTKLKRTSIFTSSYNPCTPTRKPRTCSLARFSLCFGAI